jgi:hypothetical protein
MYYTTTDFLDPIRVSSWFQILVVENEYLYFLKHAGLCLKLQHLIFV